MDVTFNINNWTMKLGRPCPKSHTYRGRRKSPRYKRDNSCVQCYRDYRAGLYQRRRERMDAAMVAWRLANPDRVKEIQKRANKRYYAKSRAASAII